MKKKTNRLIVLHDSDLILFILILLYYLIYDCETLTAINPRQAGCSDARWGKMANKTEIRYSVRNIARLLQWSILVYIVPTPLITRIYLILPV